jgi:hypothetical protein
MVGTWLNSQHLGGWAGGSCISGQLGLPREVEASLGYITTLSQKKIKYIYITSNMFLSPIVMFLTILVLVIKLLELVKKYLYKELKH